ncbi:hypothetical protein KC345_g172 [Hortaea werneckii]|nr:hypothetical protein KC345_g172 [Hortaea werneckii]
MRWLLLARGIRLQFSPSYQGKEAHGTALCTLIDEGTIDAGIKVRRALGVGGRKACPIGPMPRSTAGADGVGAIEAKEDVVAVASRPSFTTATTTTAADRLLVQALSQQRSPGAGESTAPTWDSGGHAALTGAETRQQYASEAVFISIDTMHVSSLPCSSDPQQVSHALPAYPPPACEAFTLLVVVRMDCDGGYHSSAVVHASTALKSLNLDAWGLCGRAAVHSFHYAGAS